MFYRLWRCMYPIMIHFSAGIVIELLAMALLWITGSRTGDGTGYEYAVEITGITGLVTIIPCAYLYKKDRRRREYGRLVPEPSGRPLPTPAIPLLLMFGAALSLYGNYIISFFSDLINTEDYASEMEMLEGGKSFFVLVFWLGVIAPIAEETVFRWLIYLRLRDHFRTGISVALSAALFGIYHGNMVQALYAGMLGAVMALTLEMTGNIWAPVLLHVGANVFSLSLERINSALADAPETEVGAVYLLLMAALLVFLIAGLVWVIRQGRKRGCRAV